jgi:hypothetical protein
MYFCPRLSRRKSARFFMVVMVAMDAPYSKGVKTQNAPQKDALREKKELKSPFHSFMR